MYSERRSDPAARLYSRRVKAFVTGRANFVGGKLSDFLFEVGHEVVDCAQLRTLASAAAITVRAGVMRVVDDVPQHRSLVETGS